MQAYDSMKVSCDEEVVPLCGEDHSQLHISRREIVMQER